MSQFRRETIWADGTITSQFYSNRAFADSMYLMMTKVANVTEVRLYDGDQLLAFACANPVVPDGRMMIAPPPEPAWINHLLIVGSILGALIAFGFVFLATSAHAESRVAIQNAASMAAANSVCTAQPAFSRSEMSQAMRIAGGARAQGEVLDQARKIVARNHSNSQTPAFCRTMKAIRVGP